MDPVTKSVQEKEKQKRNENYKRKFNLPDGEQLIKGEGSGINTQNTSVFCSLVEGKHASSWSPVHIAKLLLFLCKHIWICYYCMYNMNT